jgi:hypothetical protein
MNLDFFAKYCVKKFEREKVLLSKARLVKFSC